MSWCSFCFTIEFNKTISHPFKNLLNGQYWLLYLQIGGNMS